MNYYNEYDKKAAAWLRELIKQGHIPNGFVDERSITEVRASDLEGFTQCHFFAGIGGWSYALRLAGVPDDFQCWTGSPPCQPFSVAGKQLGQLDERHLAPTFMRLVDECKPAILFGEQVSAAIGKHWLDDLFTELERQGYACGSAVLPACSVGAPHKRDRLFFAAVNQLAYATSEGLERWAYKRGNEGIYRNKKTERRERRKVTDGFRSDDIMADTKLHGLNDNAERGSIVESEKEGRLQQLEGCNPRSEIQQSSNPHNEFWSNSDWLGCRDGKFRPVESGTFPLANGIPARVGRLRGYGNAIVPQVSAEFIGAFMDSML